MPDALENVAKVVVVHGGSATAGFVTAEATGNFVRNSLNLPPTGYQGLAVEGLIKGGLGLAEAWGAEHFRSSHPLAAEALDYAAAGTIASWFVDLMRVLGVSPLGSLAAKHGVPPSHPRAAPGLAPSSYYAPSLPGGIRGPEGFYPQAALPYYGPASPGGEGWLRPGAVGPAPVAPGYGIPGTIPVGNAGQVSTPPYTRRLKGPNQPIQSVAPHILVS